MAKKSKKKTSKKTKKQDTRSGASKGANKAQGGSGAAGVTLELKKELYFPTQIYFCDLPRADKLNPYLLKTIYAMREADPDGIVRSNVKKAGSWHSATDLNRREEFQQLTALLASMADQIYQNLNYQDDTMAVCDNMWANINPRYGYNRFHNHPNVLWSGVYYVQAPPNSGRIYFRDPREQAHMTTPRLKTGDIIRELWSEVYYEPIEGRALLFPAWLAHEVEPNLTDKEGSEADRVSISFNFVQRARQSKPEAGVRGV